MYGRYIAAWPWRLSAAAALVSLGFAVLGADHERRERGPHEHGHGSLDVVAEGDELVIALRIPAVNVVGFEHDPRTDEQRQAVARALAVFRQGAGLFVPSGAARCALEKVEVGLGGIKQQQGEEHEHATEHGTDGHQQRANGGQRAVKHEDAVHSELHGEYHFRCEVPERLEHVAVRVFEQLADAEEIEARLVTPTVQTAAKLTPRDTVLELAR